MDALAAAGNSQEAREWLNEIQHSQYFGCLQGQLSTEQLLSLPVPMIGMLVTRVLPPADPQKFLCGFPLCTECCISSKRQEHWKSHGPEAQKPPPNDIISQSAAVAGLFVTHKQAVRDPCRVTKMDKPALQCPICRHKAVTTNQKAWSQHISVRHPDLHKEIKSLGRFWGIAKYCFVNNIEFSLGSMLESHSGLAGCPYCTFCGSDPRQVRLHITNKHRDMQTAQGKYHLVVDTSTHFSQDPHSQDTVDEDQGEAVDAEPENDVLRQEHSSAGEELPDVEQTEDDHSITEGMWQRAIGWGSRYYHEETSVPRLNLSQRNKIAGPIRSFLTDTAIPLVRKFARTTMGDSDEDRWLAFDGVVSYVEHELKEIVLETLHLKGTRTTHQADIDNEFRAARLSRARSAGGKVAFILKRISEVQGDDSLTDQVKLNKIFALKDRCLEQVRKMDSGVVQHIFNTDRYAVTGSDLDTFLSQPGDAIERQLEYIEHSLDGSLQDCQREITKAEAKKVQELYSDDPKRAMRWFVLKESTPNCPIPVESIRQTLAERWRECLDFDQSRSGAWKTGFSISDGDSEELTEVLTRADTYTEVIRNRSPCSASGPDGVSYAILQADARASGKLLALITEAAFRFGRLPSSWVRARTIMLYKGSDPDQIQNWRPLTIAPCTYRAWSAGVARALQCLHKDRPILHSSQKGFIRGVDGCSEHTQMITEIFCDANRRSRDLYVMTIDLRDAFGSLPHEFIGHTVKAMNLPDVLILPIMDSYHRSTTYVQVGSEKSGDIRVRRGVKQGCPLSPLLFNMCLNPLLDYLEKSNSGYHLENGRCIAAQAYADDICLFAESREAMQRLIEIVERFSTYACLSINASKCKSMSYVQSLNGRVFDEVPFFISGDRVEPVTLADSVRYLGAASAASVCIRRQGAEETVSEVIELLEKIAASPLKLNQKLDAIRRFIIPRMDYPLTQGSVRMKDLDAVDTAVRKVCAEHIGTASIPVAFAETHWKDGGLSLQPLRKRADALRLRKMVGLLNSPNKSTRENFRTLVDGERRFRGYSTSDTSPFLDWDLEGGPRRSGTSSLAGLALEVIRKSGWSLKIRDGVATLSIPEEDQDITDAHCVTKALMRLFRKRSQENLTLLPLHGHSFRNLVNNGLSCSLVGNYAHKTSDKVVTFCVGARANVLYTGYIHALSHNTNEVGPQCPHCGAYGKEDSLFHRLNDCKSARPHHTMRHNRVCDIIVKQAMTTYPNARIRQNQTVRMGDEGLPLTDLARLKPDIVIITGRKVMIVEVSCPYDMSKDDGRTAMEHVYDQKRAKYLPLAEEVGRHFDMECSLHVVIVSSLGVLLKKSCSELKTLFGVKKNGPRFKGLLRRISTAALIGSYLTFYKIGSGEVAEDRDEERVNLSESEEVESSSS